MASGFFSLRKAGFKILYFLYEPIIVTSKKQLMLKVLKKTSTEQDLPLLS